MAKRSQAQKKSQRSRPVVEETIYQTLGIRSEDVDEKSRSVAVSFSSEAPVKRWGIPEVLLHEKDAADFTQLRDLGSVLQNHDPDRVVGRPADVELDTKARKGRARIIFDDDDDSSRVFRKIVGGSIKGISVGYRVDAWQILDEGQSWTTPEGRMLTGPMDVATKWRAIEFSVTPIPADGSVGVGRTLPDEGKGVPMTKKMKQLLIERGLKADASDEEAQTFLEEQLAAKPEEKREDPPETPKPEEDPPETPPANNSRKEPQDPDEAARVAARDERKRCRDIRDLCNLYPFTAPLADGLIDSGASMEQARKAVLDKLREERPPLGNAARKVEFGEDERDKFSRAAEDHLTLRTPWGRASLKDDKRIAVANEVRGRTLLDLAEECLRRSGVRVMSRDVDDIIRRAISHSTSDFPNILANVANKALLAAYQEAPATWRPLVRVASLPDFKSTSRVRLGDAGDLALTKELEPMPEGSFKEKVESYSLATYSKRFGISRQAIINDDLAAFDSIPRQMGAAAARVPATLFWDLLTSASGVGPTMAEDSEALFSASHTSGTNYTAAAGAIAIATLNTAKSYMRLQKGLAATGETAPILNVTPTYLVVPAILEAVALQYVTQITPAQNSNVLPSWMAGLKVIVEPRLDGKTNGTTAWYLASDQVDGAEVAFLNGVETPTMIRVEGTNILGVEWGVYLDCAAKFVDHRGWYRCKGA